MSQGQHGKLTPKVRARIVALAGEGVSQVQIAQRLTAEGISITRTSVQNALKDARARAEAGEALPGRPDASGGLQAAPMPDLPREASTAARIVWDRLRECREDIAAYRGQFRDGDFSPSQWAALVRTETQLAKQLQELLPPPAPDPDKDPVARAAREVIVAQLTSMVEGIEARQGRLCTRCMGEVVTPHVAARARGGVAAGGRR